MPTETQLHRPESAAPGPGSVRASSTPHWPGLLRLRLAALTARLRAVPPGPSWLLVATIACAAPLDSFNSLYPAPGLDRSWATGLNIARQHRLRFGVDLVFTYGPWGFLDHPAAVGRLNLLAGMLFAVLAAGSAWFAFRAALRPRLGENLAALGSALLVALCATAITPSALLMAAVVLALLQYVVAPGALRWVPAAAAGCAALLLQVEVTEGALVAASTVCAVLAGADRRGRRLLEALAAFGVVTVLGWIGIGQSLGDLPAWLRESLQVTQGYTEAMSLEAKPNLLPYLLVAAIPALVIGYLLELHRRLPNRVVLGIAVLAALSLYLGLREATGRHDSGHQTSYYLCALPILAWFVSVGRQTAFRLGVLAAAVLLISGSWQPISPSGAMDRWAEEVQALLDTPYRTAQSQHAKLAARQRYQLSAEIREAVADLPVAVDPWETTLAWAYDLNWHPAPVFQSYVAYTGQLDTLNAHAIATAPANQQILRAAGSSSIDGRNLLWDPPRYLLTELCDYRVRLSDSRWMLLAKSTDRCGPAQPGAVLHVGAGQRVSVPAAASDALITMSFVPDPPNLAVRLGRLLDKSFQPLLVTADAATFRLPRQLSGGPLVVQLPSTLGWPAGYGGGTSYRSIAFSEPGQVRFTVVGLSS